MAALVGIGMLIGGLLFITVPIKGGWLRYGWVQAFVSAFVLSTIWTIGLYTTNARPHCSGSGGCHQPGRVLTSIVSIHFTHA